MTCPQRRFTMSLGRPLPPLNLSALEHQKLHTWANRPTSAQRLALRSRIVLACAEGLSNLQVAQQLRLTSATVGKWRLRFLNHRLEGLADEPRPGAPRTVSD